MLVRIEYIGMYNHKIIATIDKKILLNITLQLNRVCFTQSNLHVLTVCKTKSLVAICEAINLIQYVRPRDTVLTLIEI